MEKGNNRNRESECANFWVSESLSVEYAENWLKWVSCECRVRHVLKKISECECWVQEKHKKSSSLSKVWVKTWVKLSKSISVKFRKAIFRKFWPKISKNVVSLVAFQYLALMYDYFRVNSSLLSWVLSPNIILQSELRLSFDWNLCRSEELLMLKAVPNKPHSLWGNLCLKLSFLAHHCAKKINNVWQPGKN